jgi:hypothetical protein
VFVGSKRLITVLKKVTENYQEGTREGQKKENRRKERR